MRYVFVALALALSACAAPTPPSEPVVFDPTVFCAKNNDELKICTMQYVPVCGQNPDHSWQTYSNGCDACASGATKYLPNSCEYQDQNESE